jgi:hypothetical protein
MTGIGVSAGVAGSVVVADFCVRTPNGTTTVTTTAVDPAFDALFDGSIVSGGISVERVRSHWACDLAAQ